MHSNAYKVLAGMNRAGQDTEEGYYKYPLINEHFLPFYDDIGCPLLCKWGKWGLFFLLNCITSYLILLENLVS